VTDGNRALIRVSGALASSDGAALADALSDARGVAEDSEVEEVLLQSYLFLGFPASLNGMAAWRELTGGLDDDGSAGQAPFDYTLWHDRGREVCEAVYSSRYGQLRENVRELHPDLEQWMLVEGYGKVLGRSGLSLVMRELCIVATLAVMGVPKQLYSHMRGALNVGATAADVEVALGEAERFLQDEGRLAVSALWQRVKKAVE